MTIGTLPYQLPTSSGWAYLDTTIDELATTTPAGASGVLEIDLEQVLAGQRWKVERISVQCAVPAGQDGSGIAFVAYCNQISPQTVRDSTSRGAADVADEHQPILLRENDTLMCVWTGCPAGTKAYLSVQRSIYQRVVH